RRQEFEYPLPLEDAQALLALCSGGLVDKVRHYVKHDGHLWEVDEFLGDNHGLIVAEIELQSVDEPFVLPAWAGKEVTEQSRYYNLALAEHPYRSWTDLEKS
ncbi:MAG: CYTH domain-containing protein, partial [Arenimonas sp.]|nr:CYTH domain-containing protein [Arenimonas sp.]